MNEPLSTFGESEIRVIPAALELLDLARAIRDCESTADLDAIQRHAEEIINEIERG